MNNRDLDNKIRKAFESATPDVLSSVLSDCEKQKGTVIVMQKKRTPWVVKIGALAAVLALLVGLGFGYNAYQSNQSYTTVETTVTLDVNPSVELLVNREEKVIEAKALNQDGHKILNGMDLKDSHIDLAVNALLGSMLRNGYLSDMANSILVSVSSRDAAAGASLQRELTEQINKTLSSSDVTAAVISQNVGTQEQTAPMAEQYGISAGKAQLICRILEAAPEHSFQELAALSINELTLLCESSKIRVEDIIATGTASQKQYIGAEAALTTALTAAGTEKNLVTDIEVDMDFENGRMVYEVEFDLDAREYEYYIDALNGEILYTDIDRDEDDDDDESLPTAPSAQRISAQQAMDAAFAHAGVTAASVKDLECELDEDDGRLHYEVEFTGANTEYEYEIDAFTGAVLNVEVDHDDDDDDDDGDIPAATTVSRIGAEQAKSIAFAHAGVSSVTELECELDEDDGRYVYEVEFKAGGYEYSYEIDAATGAILESDKEWDD